MNDLRLQLAKEDDAEARRGLVSAEVSLNQFMVEGIELEERQ